jgi:hypothetical protein
MTKPRHSPLLALFYVRNFAGLREWAEKKFKCYLRERKAAGLSIGFRLPPGKYTALTTDLDTHQTTETPLDAEKLQLGVTDHDFVILLRRL